MTKEEKCKSEWPDDLKKTRQREQVLSILDHAALPMTAIEICAQTQSEGQPVWLSTVYRIVELLARKGLVLKSSPGEGGMAMFELNRHEHRHYAVCVECHRVIPLEDCPLDNFAPSLKENDFHVTGHKLEMFGYCAECFSHHTK